jgi:LacI family transcriptional regulator
MNTKRRKPPVTIVDIAAKLGLSPMTVSRSLNLRKEVREATRKRVLECAAAMGYQPNRWAQSLVKRRSMIVGVVIPDIAHSFFAEITTGIEEVLERSGYDILLCHSRGRAAREVSEIGMLSSSRVDGLIVASTQGIYSPGILQELRHRETPFVLVDRFFPGYDFASVRTDDYEVGRIATKYLIGLGHRRVGYIGGPNLSPAHLRRRGYFAEIRKAGLEVRRAWLARGNFDIDGGYRAMKKILSRSPRPTAVYTANDPAAIGALYACRDAGLDVPGDMSIMGSGNIEGPHNPNPFLTTVDWPRSEMGRMAAQLLLAAMEDPSPEKLSAVKIFAPQLLVRQSTNSPRG